MKELNDRHAFGLWRLETWSAGFEDQFGEVLLDLADFNVNTIPFAD